MMTQRENELVAKSGLSLIPPPGPTWWKRTVTPINRPLICTLTYERPSLTNVIKLLTVETHTGIVFVIMHP